MKNSLWLRASTLLTGVALAVAARTAEAKLTVGDPAPELQSGKWVQGEPVEAFATNRVYIVEFWATWCVPCRVSMPHLNELSLKFKDQGLVVIGQDVWEENEDGVAPFVKKMGDQMTYRVALDNKSRETSGAMAVTWMKAAERNSIPTAFIINHQGRIAWIGHPMEISEKLLNDILADNYDPAKAAAEYEQQQQGPQKFNALLNQFATNLKDKNWGDAEATVAEIEKLLPDDQRDRIGLMRLEILLGRKDYAGFYKLTRSLSDAHPDDAALQIIIAWKIATEPDLPQRDLALATKCAERANQSTQGKEIGILDALARIQFMSGKTNEAVATEQKAVNLVEGPGKEQLEQHLTSYQQGKLPEIK